jgi:hypothetical protein
MNKRIKRKTRKKQILKMIEKNDLPFHITLENGVHISNENIDEYPQYKKYLKKNLKVLMKEDTEVLTPEKAEKEFLKIFNS